MKGCLYLLPSPISENTLDSFSPKLLGLYKELKHFAVENLRTTRRWLKSIDRNIDIDNLTFFVIEKNSKNQSISPVINILLDGNNVGVVSEAGCPGIADPGSRIVAGAHQAEIQVIPLAGPSSILMALMASGLNGQSFTFHGYLPIKKNELLKKLGLVTREIQNSGYTQIFMEAPYRNNSLFELIVNVTPKDFKLTVAREIGGTNAFIQTKTINLWQRMKPPELHKKPTIFLLGK